MKLSKYLLTFGLLLAVGSFVAMPQTAQAARPEKHEGGGLLSPRTASKLDDIRDLMSKKKFDEALQDANTLLGNVGKDYEKAVVEQMIAYIYIYKEDFKQAAVYLKRALDRDSFSDYEIASATVALAQVYVQLERYQDAANLLEQWLPQADEPPSSAYILLATSLAQMDQYKKALPYAKKAIALADQNKEGFHEDWHTLLLSLYFQLEDYPNAAGELELLIAHKPSNKDYWKNLASVYQQMNEDKKALSTLAVAYKQGLLDNGDDQLRLAQLYMLNEEPYQAAQVLDKGLSSGKIEKTPRHYEYLANAYISAKSYEEAAKALGEGAQLDKDGEMWLRQAQVYAQIHDWNKVVQSVDHAMDKGGLEEPGKAYILQGMAASEAKNVSAALKAFKKAESFKDSKDQAENWIRYVNEQVKPLVEN